MTFLLHVLQQVEQPTVSEETKTEIVENKIDETSPQIREQVDVASVEANSNNGDLTTEVKVEGNFEEEVSML